VTKKQLLKRIRDITYKHFHDSDGIEKLLRKNPELGIPKDCMVFLDSVKIAEEVYSLFKKQVSEEGK